MSLPENLRLEMLVIGDEVLDGRIVDTNSQRLAQALLGLGVTVAQRCVVTDDLDIIVREAKAIAARGSHLCVVSGGLGPTSDDLTAAAFAALMNVPLVRDAAEEARIVAYLQSRGRAATENQRAQADRPEGAELLRNDRGTAPGFAVTYAGCRFVAVPGVPREFDHLVAQAVVTPLRQTGRVPRLHRGLQLYGMAEGEADRRLRPLLARYPEVRLQFRVKFPEVHVTMHAPVAHAEAMDAAYQFAREALAEATYATEDQSFAETILAALKERGATLSVAESCTGGLMTDMLTDVAGSSGAVHLGLVAYDNQAKVNLLRVPQAILREHGAVSEPCVRAMAEGVRALVGSTYGLAVSGIAGPGGGSAAKPVGTIWCGLAWDGGSRAIKLALPYGRRDNKVSSAYAAFDLLRRHLLADA